MITLRVTYEGEVYSAIEEFSNKLFNDLKQASVISNSLSEIIVTDDLRSSISEYCKVHDVPELNISKGREYNVVSKIVRFKDSVKLFFDCNSLFVPEGIQIFNESVISIYTDEYIEKIYPSNNEFQLTDSLDEILENCLLGIWLSKLYGQKKINEVFPERKIIFNSAKSFTNGFKRNVRKVLFKYQENKDINELWIELVKQLDYYVRRAIEIKIDNEEILDLQEFDDPIKNILGELENILTQLLSGNKQSLLSTKRSIREIFRICKLEIPIFGPIQIKVKESPKSVFKDIVDTETRIVAFIDILGFTALIEEYDNDDTSNILNNLHEALELSIKTSIESMANPKIKSDLSENLDYRMFSDCISLSLPFIEFGNDFNDQLNALCTVVKIYQLTMMHKGFYIRGGIAIGSYYANKNMIFSGGLVKAYKIETEAINPIVVISTEIQERIKKNNTPSIPGIKLEDSFVYDVNDPEKVFINPFESIDNTKQNLNYIQQSFDQLIEQTDENSDDPLDKLSNSLFKMIGSFTKPLLNASSNYMTDDVIKKTKEQALKELETKINKNKQNLELLLKEKRETKHVQKVLGKLEYLKEFILWSIDSTNSSKFKNISNDR